MAIKSVVRAAVTVSVAGALSLTGKADAEHMQETESMWGTLTDLPRGELQFQNLAAAGCGKDVPGYFTIQDLMWDGSWLNSKVWSNTECGQTCDQNSHCVAFSTKRGHGKLECTLYKGLQKKPDHYAMSYIKCIKGYSGCHDGFQFSHYGTWRNGQNMERLEDEDAEECQKACKANRGCVAFTHRTTRVEDRFCLHFTDDSNKQGPKKESKVTTYSKCVLEGSLSALIEDNATAEDNSTVEDAASADEPSGVIADVSPARAPAAADEQSQGSGDDAL